MNDAIAHRPIILVGAGLIRVLPFALANRRGHLLGNRSCRIAQQQLFRQFPQKQRGASGFAVAVESAFSRMREEQALFGAGDADVAEPPLFLDRLWDLLAIDSWGTSPAPARPKTPREILVPLEECSVSSDTLDCCCSSRLSSSEDSEAFAKNCGRFASSFSSSNWQHSVVKLLHVLQALKGFVSVLRSQIGEIAGVIQDALDNLRGRQVLRPAS